MKRALVFLVLGPVLVSTVSTLVFAQMAGRPPSEFERIAAVVLFLFTLPIAALAASLDAYLARVLAMPLRAPMIAVTGAVIASGFALGLSWMLFGCFWPGSDFLPCLAIGGAACMGACSLLANDYGWRNTAVHANSLFRN